MRYTTAQEGPGTRGMLEKHSGGFWGETIQVLSLLGPQMETKEPFTRPLDAGHLKTAGHGLGG